MMLAAAEETESNLIHGRGGAYCGMLNVSYNLGLRGVNAYIPEYPVGIGPRSKTQFGCVLCYVNSRLVARGINGVTTTQFFMLSKNV